MLRQGAWNRGIPGTERVRRGWNLPASGDVIHGLGRSMVGAYARLALDVDVIWQAPLPEGPKIIAPNHPTTTDPFYILALMPEPVSILVTEAAFRVPGFGRYLRKAGHVPAVRNSGGATVEALRRQIEAGRSVAIFPEGALSPLEGGFHRPHSGVARLALSSGAPVIPVGIGLQRERIRVTAGEVGGQAETAHLYLRGPYAVTVGQPVRFSGDVEDWEIVRSVAAQVMQRIIHLARESNGRLDKPQTLEPRFETGRFWLARADEGVW